MELKESNKFLSEFGTAKESRKMQYPDGNFFSRELYLYPDAHILQRKRYFVCFWTFVGHILIYILRSNLTIAMVEMTYDKNVTLANGTIVKQVAEFNWDSKQKGFVISLFNYGYFIGPIGGFLTMKFGGATMFGFGLAATGVLTTLSPFLLRINFVLFAVTRVLEGVFEAFSNAAMIDVFVFWAPPHELSRLILLGFIGCYIGIFCNYSLCGFIAQRWGFEAVFVITGSITLVWYIVWLLFIANNPITDRFITQHERNYFKNFNPVAADKRKMSYPWKKILTSKPIWALFNEYFCKSWLFSFIGICLPLYVKDVFNVDVQTVGFISGIPTLGSFIGIFIWSCIADYLRSRAILSVPKLHKVFISFGQLSCVVFLINIGLWTNFMESIICLTLMRILSGAADVSYNVILIDMFGEYAALMRGIGSVFANAAMLLNPTIMGFIVTDHSRSSWNTYFLFLSGFNIFTLIIFCQFGTGKREEWTISKEEAEIKD